jgi:UDP-N-acetylglucosamine--N-acetylmuramyl-(pentapeptide) pyrophosphoryl-undecaprenol N-acetylglucosamine transferase
MRLLLCGGATAGHIFPITAVAAELATRDADLAVLAIGGRREVDQRLFGDAGHPFLATSAAPVVGAGARLPWNLLKTSSATIAALRAIRRFKPDIALSGGGYASIPGSIASRLGGVPLVLQANDVQPGRAARLIARFARLITVACQPAALAFGGRPTAITGLPLRPGFRQADAARARARFNIPSDRPLLVVMGGSQGARAINLALGPVLDRLLRRAHIVHLTGAAGLDTATAIRDSLPDASRNAYTPLAFLADGFADLLAAADLAVARSGGSIHEFTASALPSLLIPGGFAGGHQVANARWLEAAGAALVLEEPDLTPDTLLQSITGLLDDRERLARMATAAEFLGRPDAAARVADILVDIAASRKAA